MRLVAIVLAASACTFGATPRLVFTKSFPGSTPAYVYIAVDRTGAFQYKESPADDQSLRAKLSETDTGTLFSMAEKLDFFKAPLESGLKVANTGKKTFRYEDENGAAREQTFNYSLNDTAQQLLDRFEQIAESERAYLELDRTARFDKLGVNDALAGIESLWLRKQLAAPEQFIPLLTRIAGRESYMHLARERAARLKDAFQGPQANASGDQKSR
ncbi:MAG: hypothetical protein JOZ62_24050 [Acidobacteriaceae bacterium]|nr:hypothetical protein [Acidobacteriaceae bacterium]